MTQADIFTTTKTFQLELYLPEFIATTFVTRKLHIYECIEQIYDMILGRDSCSELGIDIRISKYTTKSTVLPYEGYNAPMGNLNNIPLL